MKRNFLFLLPVILIIGCSKQQGDLLTTRQYKTTEKVYANSDKSEQMDISIAFEYPTDCIYKPMLDSLQRFVIDRVFNTDFDSVYIEPAMSPKRAMETRVAELVNVYKRDNAFFVSEDTVDKTDMPLFFSASYDLNANVFSIVDDVMYYAVSVYSYYGGAHGLTTLSYYNINLRTGQSLTEQDLFPQLSEQQLSDKLQQALADKMGVEVKDLTDEGFFVEDIKSNGNFYATDDSIVFHFNQYEIAHYAMGPVDISVKR